MKAIVYEQYGPPDVLQLREVEKPTPKDDECLIKIHAASLNAGDWHTLRGEPFYFRLLGGLRKPRHQILGDDIAGVVEAVGANVKQFQPGDEVFGISVFGAFAEYKCVSEGRVAPKPDKVSFEQAAAVPIAAITALQGLRDKGQLQAGDKVLVNGASGGVGTFAVQLAKTFGAEVTAVCSTQKLELVRSIGADRVIDYTQEDFTQEGPRYNLILAVGGHHSISDYRRALNPGGIYVCIGGSGSQYFQAMLLGPFISMAGNKKLCSLLPSPTQGDLALLIGLVEAGDIIPVIDSCYPLEEVPEAIRYLEEGRAQGKIVITVGLN